MSFDNDDKSTSNVGSTGFDQQPAGADQAPATSFKIGEREFATQDELEKHVLSAQAHIDKIEAENAGFRERESVLSAAAEDNVSARELLEGIKTATTKVDTSVTPAKSQEELLAEAVEIVTHSVQDNLKSDAIKGAENTNLNEAMDAAQKAFGDDYISKVNALGKTHGLNGAQIDKLCKQSPQAFKNLFIPVDKSGSGPTDSDLNSSAHNQEPAAKPFVSIMSVTDNNSRAGMITEKINAKKAAQN